MRVHYGTMNQPNTPARNGGYFPPVTTKQMLSLQVWHRARNCGVHFKQHKRLKQGGILHISSPSSINLSLSLSFSISLSLSLFSLCNHSRYLLDFLSVSLPQRNPTIQRFTCRYFLDACSSQELQSQLLSRDVPC